MHSHERPLRFQQQWLAEIGYDPANDRFQEVCRDDMSFLFRWIYSDTGTFTLATSGQHSSTSIDDISRLLESSCSELSTTIPAPIDFSGRNTPFRSTATLKCTNVDLTQKNLDALPVALFSYADQFRELNFSRNLMFDFPRDFALLCTHLHTLTLSNIQLFRVPTSIGAVLTIATLNLSHNFISTLADSGLHRLSKLKSLDLRNNRLTGIESFPMEVMAAWRHLEHLDLSCNWIKGEIPKSICLIGWYDGPCDSIPRFTDDATISVNDCLKSLDLSYNLITSIPLSFGSTLPKLQSFLIVANKIREIPDCVLNSLTDLETLDVRNNRITGSLGLAGSPRAQANNEDKTLFSRKLKFLTLDQNQITGVEISRSLPFLECVTSNRNPSLIQLRLDQMLPQLTHLVITQSKLPALPDDIFGFTPRLRVLILNHNRLTSLPASLVLLQYLERIECAHNSLQYLHKEIGNLVGF